MRITEVFTLKEIQDTYGIKIDRIRVFLHRGAKGWVENVDYRKSGGTWLITREALIKKFNIDLNPVDEIFI